MGKIMTNASNRWLALIVVVVAVWVGSGCSRSTKGAKSDEFFVKWLQSHGETNIVVDAHGVGLAGNPTRLKWSVYATKQPTDKAFTTELEFRVRIPDGREIVEFVAGMGSSRQQAEDDAKFNFTVSTFHVIYRSFMNPQDEHQTEEEIVLGGQPRVLVVGDTMTRGETSHGALDMFPLRKHFRELLAGQALSSQVHWIKIVYANHQSKTITCAVTVDNEDHVALTEAVNKLEWPKLAEFYMAKQFIVVK